MRNLKRLFICGAALAAATLWGETVNGYTWRYQDVVGGVEILGEYGIYQAIFSPAPTGTVVIPSMLGGKPVVSIGAWSFYGPNWREDNLFSVTIPDSVTSIAGGAFFYCRGLTSITIPDSVTSIGVDAFWRCSKLSSMIIGSGVTSIGEEAFLYCSSLTSVTIPDSVTCIGDHAFGGCSNLTAVIIGDGVIGVGKEVFADCNSALYDTTTIPGLILVDGWVVGCDSSLSGDLDLVGVRGIANWAFRNCRCLTSVTIPDSVTSIGDSAFNGCSGLSSVTIGNGVTSIGSSAFSGCSGLTSVTIGNGVTCIGSYAFNNCTNLTSVIIPDSVTNIGDSAFYGCRGLTSVTIPDSMMSIGDNAFNNCGDNLIDTNSIPRLKLVDGWVVGCDSSLSGDLDLTGIRGIGCGAFSGCSGLTSVTIPDSVTNIGDSAFYGCRGLTSVTIPDGVTNIGDSAFYGCMGLMSMTIPDSVTNIGDYAFSQSSPYYDEFSYEFTGLRSITIGSGVKRIGAGAFRGCVALQEVTFKGAIPRIEEWAFEECTNIYCVRIEKDLPPPMFYEMGIRRFEVPMLFVDYVKTKTSATVVGIEEGETGSIDLGNPSLPLSASAIRTECDLQINVSFNEFSLPESETTVFLQTFAQGGGETVTNFTFNSAITNGAYLAVVLTDVDFDNCTGYSVSVSNSLFSGTHDFGRQEVPEEMGVAAELSSAYLIVHYGYFGPESLLGPNFEEDDDWGNYHVSFLQATSTSGVIRIQYDGDEAYGVGQSGEIGFSLRKDPLTFSSQTGWSYLTYWTTYILPSGAPGRLYAPIPTADFSREAQQYPLSYYHTCSSGDGGESYRLSGETDLVIPPSIITHEVSLDFGDGVEMAVFQKCWWYIWSGPWNELAVDDGDYFTRNFEDSLQYQYYSYCDVGDGHSGWGIPIAITDAKNSYNAVAIDVSDGYYIKRITRTSNEVWRQDYDEQTGQDIYSWYEHWYDYGNDVYDYGNGCYRYGTWEEYLELSDYAFIEYDQNGNIVATSPTQYDDSGNPLPVFGPVTEDVKFWFSSSLIPYNINFVDELGAVNTNATTYTVEDSYDFAPPAEVAGWDFLGWDVSGVYCQTGDITVTAQWSRSDRQVTFDVGAHGSRTGGGELLQTVVWGEAAVPPVIAADTGWVFAGWDADISCVTESMTVTAQYQRAPLSVAEATGLDRVWTTGGDAEWFTEWTEDAHDGTNHLHSGAIGDGQESWVETVVTNSGVVSFWWKASSESYRGVAYDKLIFTVDGAVPESVPPIGGETDWSNVVCAVEGNGPHVLRWTYRKDESDLGGEDCAWLDDVQYLREVRVEFASGGATGGNLPGTMTVGEGFEITLPGQGTLAWPKHRFLGWGIGGEVLAPGTAYALGYDDVVFTAAWEEKRVAAPTITVAAWYDTESTTVSISCETPGASIRYTLDGSEPTAASALYAGPFVLAGSATIKAVAMVDDWFDSEVAETVSVRAPWTPDECLNATGLVFTTGGAAAWTRDRTVAHDGDTAMRSGAIGDNQVSWIETEVTGAGTLTFWWRASSEAYKGTLYDRARFMVDGSAAVTDIGGITDWRFETVAITGVGAHRLRWEYYKDSQDAAGDDCVWLDEVTWTPEASPEAIDVGGVAVPTNWLDNYPTLLAEHGGYEEAAKAVAANGRPVADCFVAGLCPTNAADVFRAVISMENGVPVVSWEPDLNEGGTKHERVYTVEGKENLTDKSWAPTNSASRFFRVKVEMP